MKKKIPENSTLEYWYSKIIISYCFVYAGLAKLNSDWLLEAMPLKIWLPNNLIH
jgi:hypothetical protein